MCFVRLVFVCKYLRLVFVCKYVLRLVFVCKTFSGLSTSEPPVMPLYIVVYYSCGNVPVK